MACPPGAAEGAHHEDNEPLHTIPATVDALREIGPEVIAPCHCTGWRAVHALAAAFPNGFIPSSVGTRYVLDARTE